MVSLNTILDWIEAHPSTVGLVQWLTVIAVAWLSGALRFLFQTTRRSNAQISEVLSRCLILNEEHEGVSDATKAVFLLNIEIVNQSGALLVVNSLEIRYQTRRRFRRFSPWISAVSLPNRVRIEMGSGTKIMRNWFSYFPDDVVSLTMDGRIDPRDSQSGYALFVSHSWGSWNPRIYDGCVVVMCRALAATGERMLAKGFVHITKDTDMMEKMVPGLLDQVRHPSAWNVPARFRLAPIMRLSRPEKVCVNQDHFNGLFWLRLLIVDS